MPFNIPIIDIPAESMVSLWKEYVRLTTNRESTDSMVFSISFFIAACTDTQQSSPFKIWAAANLHCDIINETLTGPTYFKFNSLEDLHHFLLMWG
jgi:hypothetical protein